MTFFVGIITLIAVGILMTCIAGSPRIYFYYTLVFTGIAGCALLSFVFERSLPPLVALSIVLISAGCAAFAWSLWHSQRKRTSAPR